MQLNWQLNCKSTFVLRHRRENLKKCSLRGLEKRSEFKFFTYPKNPLPLLKNCVLLTLQAEELSISDRECDLLLIDGTWRYCEVMLRYVLKEQPHLTLRTLPPHLRTAYPRRQLDCLEPDRGLASIEALYAAYILLNRDPKGLLDNYHWGDDFLDINNYLK